MSEFIRLAELSRKLGISTQTIRGWMKKGKGPKPIDLGTRYIYFSRDSVNGWLQEYRDHNVSEPKTAPCGTKRLGHK